MGKNNWIHIRRHDLTEALYVNGKRIMEDDVLSAVEVLDILLPLITTKEDPILFTVDAVEELEDSDYEYSNLFPDKLEFEDIGKYEGEM